MYRRNISHILIPLALCLGIFIAYHLFLKDLWSTIPEAIEPVAENEPSPATPAVSQAPAGPTDEELKQARTIDPAVVPDTPSSHILETIRDEIERKNFALAERQLTELSPPLLSDEKAKASVAILWNNLGLEQERIDGTKASVKAFKKAAGPRARSSRSLPFNRTNR